MNVMKKKYIAPVSSELEFETLYMIAMSTSDDKVDTDGDDGGWAKEEIGGSWEGIWGAE